MRQVTPRERTVLALGGSAGAALWGLQQPLDMQVLGTRYDDVELLGRAVRPDGPGARRLGWAMHLANGAAFGLLYGELLRRTPRLSPRVAAHALAQAENFGLYPLAAVVDRVHPARDRIAPAFGVRQLAQATWRHALLGAVLGEAGERLVSGRARAPRPRGGG